MRRRRPRTRLAGRRRPAPAGAARLPHQLDRLRGRAPRAAGRPAGRAVRPAGLRPVGQARPGLLAVPAGRPGRGGAATPRDRPGRPADPRRGRLGRAPSCWPARWRATLGFEVRRRVLANGSIYMDLVQLSDGQTFLLGLPDEILSPEAAPDIDTLVGALDATFAPARLGRLAPRPRPGPGRRRPDPGQRRQSPAAPHHPLHRGAPSSRRPVERRHRDPPVGR